MNGEDIFKAIAFPEKDKLWAFLRKFSQRGDLYLVGGAVRDFLLGRPIYDLDIAVKEDPSELSYFLASLLHFTPVPLSEEFGIFRLAKGKFTLDFSLYRGETIEEDLRGRDFTINAMAIPFRALFEGPFEIYDPLGGYEDLKKGVIKAISEENISDDPLRILRGYRFLAQGLGQLEENTKLYCRRNKEKLKQVAPERINMELRFILLTDQSFIAFKEMVEDSVFEILFPEFIICKGMPQPSFHHLDVFSHSLEALKWAEEILKDPKKYLSVEAVPEEFKESDFIVSVKLGSFFHDLGKGYTFEWGDERITFYGHEKVGVELWKEIGKRLRFKNEIIEKVSFLIKNHMRPCLLLGDWEKGTLSLRAKRKLLKDCPYLYELWMVSLSDSLASKGEDKDPLYEEKLNMFFKELLLLKEEMERLEKRERILTGKDLIELGFMPGPHFKTILEDVEIKFMEGSLKHKDEAIEYVLKTYGELKSDGE